MSLEYEVAASVTPLTSSLERSSETFLTYHFQYEDPTRLEVLADTFEHAQIVRLVDEVPNEVKKLMIRSKVADD